MTSANTRAQQVSTPIALTFISLLFLSLFAVSTATAAAGASYNCLPTCAEDDGRFLAFSGTSLMTPVKPSIQLRITVPAGTETFRLGIFDGDGGGVNNRWDMGSEADYNYRLTALGVNQPILEVSSTDMIDGEWCCDAPQTDGDFVIETDGHTDFTLTVTPVDKCIEDTHLNAFKVRTTGFLTVEDPSQPLTVVANYNTLADVMTLYPDLDAGSIFPEPDPQDLVNTTYDGSLSLFFEIDKPRWRLDIWDNDFDHGNADLSETDTDDLDTPSFPPFAGSSACGTTVAEGTNLASPSDDALAEGLFLLLLREGAVRYEVVFPDGRVFSNDDPSGNREWEKFTVTTDPHAGPAEADLQTTTIPAGLYELRIRDLDLQNPVAVMIPGRVVAQPSTEDSGGFSGFSSSKR